jgi:MFS transporter, SHS family, sialic acid transporter
MALVAAFLGWMFDGFEMGLFPLIGKPALQDLLHRPDNITDAAFNIMQGQWFTAIIAVFLVGAATGGVLFGWLGDKLGRVKAMALAIFTYAVFTGLCAFVTEAWHLAALRFVASLGMGGEWSLGVALVNELWAGRNRAWIAGMIGAAANFGFMLVGILSLLLNSFLSHVTDGLHSLGLSHDITEYLLHNRAWRLLAVSGALPALINFFILIVVPESHKWEDEKKSGQTSHWKTGDLIGVLIAAVAALVIIYAWSPMAPFGYPAAAAVTVAGITIALWGYLHPVRQYLERAVLSAGVSAEQRGIIMRHLLIGAGLAGVALLGTWGSAQQTMRWSTSLIETGSKYPIADYTQIATAIGAILISLITPLIADKLGRRVTYTSLCVLALISAFLFFKTNQLFHSQAIPSWFFISAFLIGGLTASFYGFFPLYFPELFPTSVRATGQGFCFNFGRLIAAVGSLQLASIVRLFEKPDGSPQLHYLAEANAFCVLSSVYVLGMVLIWFAPETKGKRLE